MGLQGQEASQRRAPRRRGSGSLGGERMGGILGLGPCSWSTPCWTPGRLQRSVWDPSDPNVFINSSMCWHLLCAWPLCPGCWGCTDNPPAFAGLM